MSNDEKIVISVSGVTKKFRLYYDKPHTLKDNFIRLGKGSYKDFIALKDVSFNIPKGYTVGIMGKNGSGKSTLLKLLSRTMYPDKGRISINGKVSSLIELGAGFHPDMTGYENIFNNAAIFGLTKEEIKKRIPHIIEFSELEDFINNPVRTYSSGMYARLAFAVAIHVDADILLIDEILSVGDMNFQAKCEDYFIKQQELGTTMVLVTHDIATIEKLCDHAILLEYGSVIAQGKPDEVKRIYCDRMNLAYCVEDADTSNVVESRNPVPAFDASRPVNPALGLERWGNQDIVIFNVKMLDIKNNVKSAFSVGDEIRIQFDYFCRVALEVLNPIFGFSVYSSCGQLMYETDTNIDNQHHLPIKQNGIGTIVINKMMLLPGNYLVNLFIRDKDGLAIDYLSSAAFFTIQSHFNDVGIVRLEHSINIGTKKR